MKTIFVFLMCCISSILFAQTDVTFVDNWKVHPVPTNYDTLNTYGTKGTDWMVYFDNDGKICVKQEPKPNERKLPFMLPPARFGTKKYPGQKAFIEVDNGYLVSFTGGDYGDKLFWYSKNGQENELVAKLAVLQFIKRDDKIYAIQATENGSIIEISKQNSKWITTESTKLPFLPDAIGIDNNKNFIVITTESLVEISQAGVSKTLINEGFWTVLFPNSLVVKGDYVYSGMRGGIFRFNTKTKKQEWLTKD